MPRGVKIKELNVGRVSDKSIMSTMSLYINRYTTGEIELMDLIQSLERALSSLESIDNEWKKAFLNDWIELEIIHSYILERDKENIIANNEEKNDISNILFELKKKIKEKEATIEEHFCPSCGIDISDSCVWENLSVEYVFCHCCGLKIGRESSSIQEVHEKRDQWLLHPEFWHDQKTKPDEWNIEKQMENIPIDYM